MSENEKKSKLSGIKIFQKFKGVKNLPLIIALVLGAIIVLIYLSTFNTKKTDETSANATTELSVYQESLEGKLESTLSKIKGAGSVKVMVTFESGIEKIYATEDEIKNNSITNGSNETSTSSSSSSPIVIGNEPLVVSEKMPEISGVVVISSGAGDTSVRLELLRAVQTLLNVPSSNISILVGNKK